MSIVPPNNFRMIRIIFKSSDAYLELGDYQQKIDELKRKVVSGESGRWN